MRLLSEKSQLCAHGFRDPLRCFFTFKDDILRSGPLINRL